jgi:protein-glutamine gamma-glutamyltransferase
VNTAPVPSAAAWLLVTGLATVLPHAIHLPAWLTAVCALLLLWRADRLYRNATAPNRLVILLVALAVGAGVKAHYGHFFGKEPGIALLAALLCLKMLETRTPRDVRAAVLLSFFLQLGLFLHQQSPTVAALALVGSLAAIATLLSLHDDRAGFAAQLRTAAQLLAHGLPFMVVLFVLFPRVQGPLWGLPSDAHSGMTGLSDSMAPGSISQLGLSDAIVFRAEFQGSPPPPSLRYWRGPVLTLFDGRQWRPAPFRIGLRPDYQPAGTAYDYQITLEPHNRPWLLALDFSAARVAHAAYASDFQVLAEAPVRSRTQFEFRAYPSAAVGLDEAAPVLAAARRLPFGSNPRSLALGRTLAQGAPSPAAILRRILDHLRASDLVYTLSPPLLGTHTVDEFLFDTRRGFCEHFAASFVFLARAAGLPARVVTGYQGGEINPVDRSLVVRQSDAHAWAEVWLAERGWIRVDPTAIAAPERIEGGLAAALSGGEPLPYLLRPELSWLRGLRYRWDALSNTWNRWVLGYNPDRQRELLEQLGVRRPDWQTMTLLLVASSGILTLALGAWAYRRWQRPDRLDRAWGAFCARAARRGLVRQPWEGPLDFGRRVEDAFPAQATAVREVAASYARLRYGAPADPAAVRALARQIRRLNLK